VRRNAYQPVRWARITWSREFVEFSPWYVQLLALERLQRDVERQHGPAHLELAGVVALPVGWQCTFRVWPAS
jgi:hypothetical protein